MSEATPSANEQGHTAPAAPPKREMKRGVIIALAVIALLVAGWSAFWWQSSRVLDAAVGDFLANNVRDGVRIDCPQRRIGGYPFLLDVRCASVALAAPGAPAIAAGRLIVGARVYDPNRVVAELTGPLTVGDPAAPFVAINWKLAQMSLHLQDGALILGAVSIDHPTVLLPSAVGVAHQNAAADLLEAHVRPTPAPASGTDFAFTAEGVKVPGGSIDSSLLVTLEDGGATLLGAGLAIPMEGLVVDVTRFSLGNAGATLEATGKVRLKPNGLLDGDLTATVIDPAGLPALLGPMLPSPGTATALAGAISVFGVPSQVKGRPARSLPVKIVQGAVSIGGIRVGAIPPILWAQ